MAITVVDKIKINKYLKENTLNDICYLDMCDALGKRGKISDIEFLEYFTDRVVSEFRKNDKISIKQLTKIVFIIETFLVWIHESGFEIKEDILDQIRSFQNFYEDYLSRTELDMDLNFNDNCIGSVLKTINDLYPCEIKSESIVRYVNKIAELEGHIQQLKKELGEVTKLYNHLQVCYVQKSDKIDSLNREVTFLTNGIKNKSKELTELNEMIGSLNVRIRELETSLSQAQEEKAVLTLYKEQYETLTVEVAKLRKVIEDDIISKRDASNLKIKQSEIEALIYQKILFERANLDEILMYVKERGFVSDRNEISNLLKRIKNRINVDSSSFSLSPVYKIVAPSILEDGQFSVCVPARCKHYDIMLVSDFHIEDFDNRVLTGLDILNDYCVINDIHLILNLGDFYHGFGDKSLSYDNAIKNYKAIEQSISLMPRVDGLYHAILGGNHDKNIVKYGFDPVKFLAEEREDIINLGYTHSTIELNRSSNVLGRFDIHHPDTYDFSIDLDDDGIDIAGIDRYLRDIYNKQGRSRDDSYIDIFGHTHKSQFNYPGSYCYIPPFFCNKTKRGACHLKVYFDEDNKIKYMVFMPLGFYSNKLVKNNEIIYKKVLNK